MSNAKEERKKELAAIRRMTPGEKAKRHPKSAKLAIAAFCYHSCMSETRKNAQNVKLDIRDCQSTKCELWPHRGWQKLRDRANSARTPQKEKPDEV